MPNPPKAGERRLALVHNATVPVELIQAAASVAATWVCRVLSDNRIVLVPEAHIRGTVEKSGGDEPPSTVLALMADWAPSC